jgi:WD40 repeat protein
MHPEDCPTEYELTAFNLGDLPGPDLDAIAGHLEGCTHCERRLEQLEGGVDDVVAALRYSPDTPAGVVPNSTSLSGGDRPAAAALPSLPGYVIERALGQGGAGMVYQARDRRLGRRVALKVLGHVTSVHLARFAAEAKAVARLSHPNIIQIYEVGEHQGVPFLALELAEGGSLADRTEGRPQPLREAAGLLEVLARAVHYAHEQGIVHRDLKPDNVLLARGPAKPQAASPSAACGLAFGVPKIADFGLAKCLDGPQGYTRTGEVMGTPSYMAPEQASGKSGPAVDVWALGAILYDLLTGRPPFQGERPAEVLHQVVFEDPVPVAALRRELPRDLAVITHKCLDKEPRRRYASAGELADDLARFLAGEPIRARPLGPLGRAAKWARRRPAVAALLAALLAVTLLGVAGVLWKYREARHEAFLKTQALGTAQEAEARAVAKAGEADQARRKAVQAAAELRRQLTLSQSLSYAGQITLAEREAQLGNRMRALFVLGNCPPQQCGWEHAHLGRRLLGCLPRLTLRGHAQPILAVAWSPDGTRLASAAGQVNQPSRPGELFLWEARPDARPLRLRGHTGPVLAAAFSPDGKVLAGGSLDGTVRLWDAHGALRRTLATRAGAVSALAFAPDGTRLACAGRDGSVRIWDARSGAERLVLRIPDGELDGLAFSPDGTRLAGAGGRAVRLWDAHSGALLLTLAHPAPVHCVAFSPAGDHLASASDAVQVWDTATGRPLLTLTGHPPMHWVAFRPDGRTLASLGGDSDNPGALRELRLWDARTGASLLVQPGAARSAAFSPDGGRLACPADSAVVVLDLRAGSEALVLRGHLGPLEAVAFSPDGKTLASTGGGGPVVTPDQRARASAGIDPSIKLWDGRTGVGLRTLHGHTGRVSALAFSPDGKTLASGSADQTVRLWDVRSGVLRRILPVRFTGGLAFSPDGRHLACGEAANLVGVWDPDRGARVLTLRGHGGPVSGLAFSPDGRRLASGSSDNTVRLWGARRGTPLRSLPGHGNRFLGLAFSPDGTRLISFGGDSILRVRDREGRPVRTGSLYGGLAWGGAFSRDGRRLAIGYQDGAVRLWDADTGVETLTLRGHEARATGAAFSPDGTRLASVSDDGTVRLWDARPDVDARAWHNQQADQAEQAGDWFAAHFHLDRLERAEPDRPALLARRGRALMELGQTERGLADLARPLLRQDEDYHFLSWHARACLARADVEGYRQARAALLRGFAASANRAQDAGLARTCVLAAATPQELLPAWRLAATMRATGTGSHAEYAVTGAALLRTGRLPEAIGCLKQARTLRLLARQEVATDELLLALAYARQGQLGLARRWLARVDAWLAAPHLPGVQAEVALLGAGRPAAALGLLPILSPPRPDPHVRQLGWEVWLEVQLLRREAAVLLARVP